MSRPECSTVATSPIIGVLCIDAAQKLNEEYGLEYKSYIAASYVKFLEASGASVVPIWIGRPRSYYEEIMTQINGVLIPGGAVFFDSKYNTKPEQSNDCIQNFRKSNMFSQLDGELERLMRTEKWAHHHHKYCITRGDFMQFKIENQWKILATNKDCKGLEFVSIVEHTKYPFYGCQFHPERVCFEHNPFTDAAGQTSGCVRIAQYLGNFFVSICRKSPNRFPSHLEELRHSISNFQRTFTGHEGLSLWTECFLFKESADYPAIGQTRQSQ